MQGRRVSEEKNVFWSLLVRGTDVFFVPPGGWDAKKIRSLRSRHKSVPHRNIYVEKPMSLGDTNVNEN